jgi:hypothetical protein
METTLGESGGGVGKKIPSTKLDGRWQGLTKMGWSKMQHMGQKILTMYLQVMFRV